jgi:integrase
LRHTTAARLRADPTVTLDDIAVALGHADTRMAQRYAHLQPGHMLGMMQKLTRAPKNEGVTDLGTDLEPPQAVTHA